MKKYIKLLFSFIAVFTLITIVSCDDDEFSGNGKGTGNVSIASISPGAEYPDETVTLVGTGFNEVQFVFVGNLQAEFQLDGDTIYFVVPTKAVVGMTTVTLAMAENYRVSVDFEVLLRPTPVIETITPSAAAPGENVTISGVSLNNLSKVTVEGVEATVVSSTESELVFAVPDGPQVNARATIEIITSGGKATSESIFYVGTNLLLNGELEEGDGDEFTNWGKWNGGEGMTATTNANEAYVGRSLKAVGDGRDAWRTQFVSDPVPTSIGVEYTAFVWIKAEAAGGNMRFSTNESAGAQYSGNYDIETEWQQIEWVITATSAETRLVLDMGATTSTFFVDNITMIETGAAAPQPVEILLNGDLELGDGDNFTNWGKWNGGDRMTAETSDVHGGSRALKVVNPAAGNPWDTQFVSDAFTTEVGVIYTVSMWIKGEDGTVRFSTNASAGAQYAPNFTVTADWQKYTWEFTANDIATRIALDMGASAASYIVDDISVLSPPVVAPPPSVSLVLNGDFELGDGNDFTNWGKWNGPDNMTAETSEVHGGSRALKVVNPADGNEWSTQLGSDAIELEVGANYTVSFWIKGTVGGVVRVSTNNATAAQYFPNYNVTADWGQYTHTFVANDASDKIVLDLGKSAGTYYVDDVELFKD